MRKQETITVGERQIEVKELTVTDLDALFATFDIDRQPSLIEQLIESPIPMEVVVAATGIGEDELKAFAPTELSTIWAATARVNDFLSRRAELLDRILGNAMADLIGNSSGGSSAKC